MKRDEYETGASNRGANQLDRLRTLVCQYSDESDREERLHLNNQRRQAGWHTCVHSGE